MPTEAQYLAVGKIDRALRVYGGNRLDSTIGFPKSEADHARAKRKASAAAKSHSGRPLAGAEARNISRSKMFRIYRVDRNRIEAMEQLGSLR